VTPTQGRRILPIAMLGAISPAELRESSPHAAGPQALETAAEETPVVTMQQGAISAAPDATASLPTMVAVELLSRALLRGAPPVSCWCWGALFYFSSKCNALSFWLLVVGGEGVNIQLSEDTRAMDFARAPSEDDKMLLDCLEHVSGLKV
jgi:hypothetical protein